MKPIDIRSLLNSVLNALMSFGVIEENRVSMNIPDDIPEHLYGDSEEIRKILYMIMINLGGTEDTASAGSRTTRVQLEVRPGIPVPEDAVLEVIFQPVQIRIDTIPVKPLLEKLEAALEYRGTDGLLLRIPVRTAPSADLARESAPCSLDAIVREVQDREIAAGILRDYVVHLENQIRRMETFLRQGNAEAVHREAHSIKGGAMNIRAERLQHSAHSLEISARGNRLENGTEMLENIKKAYMEIAAYVSTLPEG